MNRKYLKWTAVITLLVIGAAALVGAQMQQHRGWGPGMMHRHFMGFLVRQLQLTDAQQAQIKSMWQAEKPAVVPLLQQLANEHKQMLALTAGGSFDETKVRAVANQQSQTLAQLMVEKEKLISQVYNQVLTSEQRAKVDQMRANRAQRIDEWLQHLDQNSPPPHE